MPKPTFFNLSMEKQELLINAAKKEFSRVPLYDASISNIIKDAGIPRGSFYQYFEDKEDIFFFLIDEDSKQVYQNFISIIKINNGDLFTSFVDLFKSILINFAEPKNRQYIKNAFLNMNYKIEKTFTKNFYEENVKSKFFELNDLIKSKSLNIANEEEMFHILKIMMVVMIQNLVDVFARELPAHEAIAAFSLEIDLLKKGFYSRT
ncbi:MAG: TetR family transcriptional regulator [Bacillota bacterium]|nr:TetR family transcriptional regulator [Bacillota bacterium]